VTEDVVLNIVRSLAAEYDCPNLCLAGGVALNCVANGKVEEQGGFENIWVQPASGDAGGALGAALITHHHHLGNDRHVKKGRLDAMAGSYLGPEFSQAEIESALDAAGARYNVVSDDELVDTCARAIAGDRVIGWMQGRMEFGPRALGGRSIIGSATSESAQKQINLNRYLPDRTVSDQDVSLNASFY